MTDDLVKRLRERGGWPELAVNLWIEAADRIEALERERDALLADGSLATRRAGLAVYASVVRREALEEAAREADAVASNPTPSLWNYGTSPSSSDVANHKGRREAAEEIAAAIRALKEKE